MSLRSRIAAHENAGAGSGIPADSTSHLVAAYRTKLLEEIDLAEMSALSPAERRARHRHRMPTTGVEYGVAVGLLYGVSSLAIKGVSSHLGVLGASGFGGAALGLLRSPYPYLLLFTGAFGLVMSQAALQRCRASLIVPPSSLTAAATATIGHW